MHRSVLRLGFIQFELHNRGFQTSLQITRRQLLRNTALDRASSLAKSGQNVAVLGAAATGKRTFLNEISASLSSSKKAVVVTSTTASGCVQLGGFLLSSFLGLKPNAEVVSVEAAAASIARHIRSMSSLFANIMPSLMTCDVLVIDQLELVSPLVIQAFDLVAKDERKSPLPFGGIQVIASANFWRMGATPSSSFTGNLFQLDCWENFFPPSNQVAFWNNFVHLSPESTVITNKALFGTLSQKDIQQLEGSSGILPLVDENSGIMQSNPRFPKYPSVTIEPKKKATIRTTALGQYLCSLLVPLARADALGLRYRLHLEVGDKVALMLPMLDHSLPAGMNGTVVEVQNHFVAVRFANKVINIPRLRVTVAHQQLPEISFTTSQFPLYKLNCLDATSLINENVPVPDSPLAVDARLLTNTNDLGNLLTVLPSAKNIFSHLNEYTRRENFVHEPTRIFMEQLLVRDAPKFAQSMDLIHDEKFERWCKNCKTHIEQKNFWNHWSACVKQNRWCTDCGCTVPMSKWDAHCEKHTVVMCIDCGRALEWKGWDQHRLSCGAMLREVSAENDLLPQTTKSWALEAAIDRTDLHTVKEISRSSLPKTHKDLRESRPALSKI